MSCLNDASPENITFLKRIVQNTINGNERELNRFVNNSSLNWALASLCN